MATATKRETKYPVQELAMRAITVDHDLQSRVATSVEYQREFSEAMLRGDVFPPVTVFFDGKEYWLADGFHRFGAAKAIGKVAIRAEMREGGRREAVVFSAGANQQFSIPRTNDDKRKAVEMLLGDEEWFNKAMTVIAVHVGVSTNLVRDVRLAYCQTHGKPLPQEVVRANGTLTRASSSYDESPIPNRIRGGDGAYRATVMGKTVELGADRRAAEAKALELTEAAFEELRRSRIRLDGLKAWLAARGILVSAAGNSATTGLGQAWIAKTAVIATTEGRTVGSMAEVIGRVILNRARWAPESRMIVCHVDLPECEAMRVARTMGVEFMTPDELVEALAPATATH